MLQVLDPGFLTTVQDLGRIAYQKYGVSVGGAMDPLALRAANRLVGNSDDEAALEITLSTPSFHAMDACLLGTAGAQYELSVNERRLPSNVAFLIRAGETLEFTKRTAGARVYLAIAGGIDVPLVLRSRSTDVRGHFGGMDGRPLRPGDVIPLRARVLNPERAGSALPEAIPSYYTDGSLIRVVEGPHTEFFVESARAAAFRGEYTVSELSDRMALRLRGEPIERVEKELLSCGVTLGAIQVPPDGQPIILMADHQTAGGYPILATVIRADIPRLAQVLTGGKFTLRAVSIEQAIQASGELENLLQQAV